MDKLEDLELYNNDCFKVFPDLQDNSVNLFLLDLPYNQTAYQWDKDIIPLDQMWENIKRIMKPDGIIVMFCTARFGYRLIQSNPKWFRYDLIWKKSRKVGFLSANKMPLRQHENIYLFSNNHITYCKNGKYGTYNPQKTKGKPYKMKGGKSKNVKGSLSANHEVISKEYENKGDRFPSSIIEHENIYIFKEKLGTYNPQKTKGKPYIQTGRGNCGYYGNKNETYGKNYLLENKGDRFPTSLIESISSDSEESEINELDAGRWCEELDCCEWGDLNNKLTDCTFCPNKFIPYKNHELDFDLYKRYYENDDDGDICIHCLKEYYKKKDLINYDGDSILVYNNPHKTLHTTQKPIELCEWLVKTYSNERDVVMDFTMGSGTVAIACLNTNRKFIGIEKEKDIYEKAENRIMQHLDI